LVFFKLMSFSALDRYYVKLFEVNLDFLLLKTRQHTIPWNKVHAVPSILHTVEVNWNSRSEIDTAYTGKCHVALNNKQFCISVWRL
jgi:hypothetical protein